MKQKRLIGALSYTLILVLTLLVVFPVLYGFLGSFKRSSEFTRLPPKLFPDTFGNVENYQTIFSQFPFARYFGNSIITTLLTSVVKLFLAILAAYAFVFFSFRGRRFFFIFLLGTMMLPADTLLVANYQTVSHLGLIDHYLGICIVSFVGASQMFMLRQAFRQAPRELREAAQLDGCGDFAFLFTILVPVTKPVVVTLFMQSFVAQWNAYLWPLLVTNVPAMRTLQVGITMLTSTENTNYQIVLAGTTVSLILPVLLFILVRKRLEGSIQEGTLAN